MKYYDRKLVWLLFATGVVAILEILSLANLRLPSPFEIPFFLLFIFIIGYQTLWHGLISLITFNFKSIQALMLIAVAGAWYLGKYEEAAVVIVLYTLAEKLEDLGIEKSQSALNSLIEKMPQLAHLKNLDKDIPVEEVQIGDIILVKPFEMIGLDGIISGGISLVDESTITGEPIPQEKFTGEKVYAGTVNKQGYLEIEVTKSAHNTTFAKIKKLASQASQTKAPTEQIIEKFSEYYTPFIIGLALVIVFFPPLILGYPFDPWLFRGLTLLVIACPCALVISTPISIFSALGNASKKGVLIKGGKYLEAIGQIRAMALDKTKTLTYGRPVVSEIIPYGNTSKAHVLECAAGIEVFSEHPLAQSIVEAARKEGLSLHAVENFKSFVGRGAQADCLVCSDKHHCLGKLPFILEEHPVPKEIVEGIEELLNQGKTAVVVATHKEIEGVIALTDEIRPESKDLIQSLNDLDIHPVILTGDHSGPAKLVAEQLGIKEYHANLLPEDKVNAINKLIDQHHVVAMVGDGVNDAPALAAASVGITLSSLGSDTAIEAASIVILNERLTLIPYLIQLGKKTLQVIKLNLTLAISIKIIFIILALLGMTNLAFAIFADVGVTLIVILLSLRLLNSKWTPQT